jgi:hypothetical protein
MTDDSCIVQALFDLCSALQAMMQPPDGMFRSDFEGDWCTDFNGLRLAQMRIVCDGLQLSSSRPH